jgi:hypothetical protein
MLADTVPPWLATMRRIDGTLEAPGSADNPVILSWSDTIARAFPDMASYASSYKHDSIAWCGQALAYVMAANGIRPPYDPDDDLKSYLWVDSWDYWGTRVPAGQERLGDVLVFSSPHHVTLYEGEEGGWYLGHGGNQSDKVQVSRFAKSGIRSVRRPPHPTAMDEMPVKVIPAGSLSRRFHSLIGGFYSSTPMSRSSGPVAIRTNNPGAINGVAWARTYPGYVSEIEITPGHRSSIFETPEHGVAAWYELIKKYHSAGATTLRELMERHCAGEDYSDLLDEVVARTGVSADHELALEGDDTTLLRFAKAMFDHAADRETPLSDNQILYGFKLARDHARQPFGSKEMQIKPQGGNPLLIVLLLMMLSKETATGDDPADPAKPWRGDIQKVLPLLLQSLLSGRQIDIPDLWQGDIHKVVPLLLHSLLGGRPIDIPDLWHSDLHKALPTLLHSLLGGKQIDISDLGQGAIHKVLPLLLHSALTGRKIEIPDLLSAILTDASAVNGAAPSGEAQRPNDMHPLLLPLLFHALTDKHLTGRDVTRDSPAF